MTASIVSLALLIFTAIISIRSFHDLRIKKKELEVKKRSLDCALIDYAQTRDELSKYQDKFNSEYDQCKTTLYETKQEIRKLQYEKKQLQEEKDKLLSDIANEKTHLNQIKNEAYPLIEKYKKQYELCRNEMNIACQDRQRAIDDAMRYKDELKKYKDVCENNNSTKGLIQLQEKINSLQSENNEFSRQMNEYRRQSEKLQIEKYRLDEEVRTLNSKVSDYRDLSDMYLYIYKNYATGEEYERYIAAYLLHEGYRNIRLTARSGDYGADILATLNGTKYCIQCKKYDGNSVGNSAVQEVFSAQSYYKCDVAMVITSSTFTKNAKELASKIGVMLMENVI